METSVVSKGPKAKWSNTQPYIIGYKAVAAIYYRMVAKMAPVCGAYI